MFSRHIKMSDVAMFVGAALNHPMPPCNGYGFVSTIHVSQYKSKFDDVRIYCQLAHPGLVRDLWASLKKEGEVTPEFKNRCLVSDAKHYRECHLAMIRLLDDKDLITSLKVPAQHPELLCETIEELDGMLDNSRCVQHFCSTWNVSDPDSLRDLLHMVSGFRKCT